MEESRVRGEFEVKLTPREGAAESVGRMTIEKSYRGALEALSRGEMLTAGTTVPGSAGYVAIERVDGDARRSSRDVHPPAQRDDDARDAAALDRGRAGLGHGRAGRVSSAGCRSRSRAGSTIYVFEYTLPEYGHDEEREGEGD